MKNLAEPLTAESTQTIRALTRAELDAVNQPKWYVVQLVISDQPINLEMMPRLDVFAEHHLYTVVGRQGGVHRHALRLGFFSEERSAQMMCKHLHTLFAAPSVVRVSVAEHERFAGKPEIGTQSSAPAKSAAQAIKFAPVQDQPIAKPLAAATPVKPTDVKSPSVLHTSAARNDGPFLPPEVALKTGAFRALAPQARSIDKSSTQASKPLAGAHARAGAKKGKSLAEELMEEARQVQLSRSGKRGVPEPAQSWLSRLLGRSKR